MAEQFPRRFGRYILLDKVNAGGMAEVFRAKVSGTDNFQRLVAIKCMLPSLADDEEFATMFVDEARLAAQLNHGSIVQIYELGRHDKRLYIAMELVHGHDLRGTTKRARKMGKRLGVGFVAYILSKAAEALDYAHNKLSLEGTPLNLVHRDVSPQNILVSYDGQVKVVDFGIAKAEHRATETRAGTLKGKFAYMAPEQVLGERTDRRADIFALGSVLYEAATGRPLFHGETDLAILERVKSADLPDLEEHLAHAPAQLCKVIRRACARKPEERYQSALDFADDLAPVLISRGNLFGPKNARTTMRVLYADEWRALPRSLKNYAAMRIEGEPEPRSHTQVLGVLLSQSEEAESETTSAAKPNARLERDEVTGPVAEVSTDTELFSPQAMAERQNEDTEAAKMIIPSELNQDASSSKGSGDEIDTPTFDDDTGDYDPGNPRPAAPASPAESTHAGPSPLVRAPPEPAAGRAARASGSWNGGRRLLDEIRAAPPKLRYALLGLIGACVLVLVVLVVVLLSRDGGGESRDPVVEPRSGLVQPLNGGDQRQNAGRSDDERAKDGGDEEGENKPTDSESDGADELAQADTAGEATDAGSETGSATEAGSTAEATAETSDDSEGSGSSSDADSNKSRRRFAYVKINSPGVRARVVLDGRDIGFTPIGPLRVRTGRHRLRLVASSGQAKSLEVVVSARYTESRPMNLDFKLR